MPGTRKWTVTTTAEFSTYADALEFAEYCESLPPVISTEIIPLHDE